MFDDLMNFFGAISNERSTIIDRTDIDGFTVSTVNTSDCGPETAIIDAIGAHPVERYTTVEKAKEGHQKWVNFIKSGERNITKLGYGTIVDAVKITLRAEELHE